MPTKYSDAIIDMLKRFTRYFWAGVLQTFISGFIFSSGCTQTTPSKPVQALKGKPTVVVSKPIVMPIVEWDAFVGRLEPIESVQVRSRVSGYLASTDFEEGQLVGRGDLIAVIDQRPFLSEVSRSRANLAEAEAQLLQSESQVAQAQAEAKRSTIHRDLARKQLDRNSILVKQKATALQDFEIDEADFLQSEADVLVANSRVKSSQSAVLAAQASVRIAKANLELAELNMTYTEIRAPIDGRISYRYATEGNFISGGSNDSTLLTTIVSLDPIYCYFDTDEQTYLKYMQLSQNGKGGKIHEVRNPVYLALANESNGFPHQGYLDFIDNRMDEKTGTIRVRAILPNDQQALTPGLFARVRLPGSPKYEAILIPDKAIGTDQAEKFVLTVDANEKIVRKGVTLGPMSHGLRIIRSGLTSEDRVVMSGQQRAKQGMEVGVKSEEVVPGEEVLPDDYEPIGKDKLLSTKRKTAGNVSIPPADTKSLMPSADEIVPKLKARQPE